jgi:putative transposase
MDASPDVSSTPHILAHYDAGSRGRPLHQVTVRKRGGRKRALGTRRPLALPSRASERWSLDFVSDAFTDHRRFRVLAVVDDFTRECLALVADTSLSGRRLARELDAVIARRGKPMQNGFVESFNGSFRDECLNETLFSSLTQARIEITAWKEDCNRNRPHSSLGNMTPSEFAMKMAMEKLAARSVRRTPTGSSAGCGRYH